MTVKEIAKEVIDTLPDETTIDEIIHALYVNAKFQHGEKEIKEGKGISHDDAILIDQRLEEYHKNPDSGSPWINVKKRILNKK